ncbi:hypothetical protein HK100_004602 [Physocladia obscura]|uniref:RRM domain-containing protein n=1 Tax=Physocladia obscura TaxID=109957 RepID=A0AAD5SSI2_9FUNG|nr:hypothetical protein HK100_004602 [Physocladia obscura]
MPPALQGSTTPTVVTPASGISIIEKQPGAHDDVPVQQYPPPISLTYRGDGGSVNAIGGNNGGGGGYNLHGATGTPYVREWSSNRPKTIWGGRNPESYDRGLLSNGPKCITPILDPRPGASMRDVKIMTRTLFIGNLTNTTTTDMVRTAFASHARVRVCGATINAIKNTGFVKLYTREEAHAAKDAMNKFLIDGAPLTVGWGCGFGPREHFTYATGETAYPVTEMTDADRKAILGARFGGGCADGGYLIEEPDIQDPYEFSEGGNSGRGNFSRGGGASGRSGGSTSYRGHRGGGGGYDRDRYGRGDGRDRSRSRSRSRSPPRRGRGGSGGRDRYDDRDGRDRADKKRSRWA